MSYTIVYDRRFIKAGDRYIPFCLFGSSNCTFFNPATGKEVLERSWSPFTYNDSMILGTAEEIMAIVRKLNDNTHSDNFKFHAKWLSDEQVIRFFENGIKNAVTVEDLNKAARERLHCYLSTWYYINDPKTSNDTSLLNTTCKVEFSKYIKDEGELVAWIAEAKKEKERILQSGTANSCYICCKLSTTAPVPAVAQKEISEPCVAKTRKNGFVANISANSISWTKDPKKAKVFSDSNEAYLALSTCLISTNATLMPAKNLEKLQKANDSKKFVLSVLSPAHGRVYVMKKTRNALHYSYTTSGAKKFATPSDATKWFQTYVVGRFAPEITNPVIEAI